MQNRQQRDVQAFRRVQSWSAAHPDVLQPGSALAKHLDTLNGVVSRVETNAAAQVTQGKLTTDDVANVAQLRSELRMQNMHYIAQVAQGLKNTVPGIGILRMPGTHVSTETLLAAADSMAANGAIYKDVLIQHGLPQNFLDTLQAATTALRANVDARGTAASRQVAATQAIHTDIKLGTATVGFMDAIVRMTFRSDPASLAEWRKAKRSTTKGVPSVVDPTAPVTPAVAPAAKPTAAVPVAPAAIAEPVKAQEVKAA